jgi:two-component system sensor histidine kinase CiaH
MFRSATFKLTMWYMTIVMLISLAFSMDLYSVATGELRRGLHRETERIYNQFPVFENNPSLPPPSTDFDSSAHRILFRLVGLNVVVLVGAGFASYWLARKTLEPIEAAHEQQKRFTADVSHELRTPLTALRMESEVALLNKHTTKEELRKTLGSNLEEVGKIESLINNLLRLTRLESEELQQSFEPLENKAVIEQALEQIRPAADAHNIHFAQRVEPAMLSGDRESLVQLLVILLDNAVKYSPTGRAVEVSSQRRNDQVVFSIKDQGAGIEPKALDHVFDRFYRADTSRTKTSAEGYGLGLSIAKMIADLHQGTITLSSRLHHGTTAIVALPYLEPAVAPRHTTN